MTDADATPADPRAKASSPFIWPPVIYATTAAISGLLAWLAPLPFVPAGATGWLIRLVGLLMLALGLAVAFSAERGFKRVGTPVPPTRPTTALVTEGVYARTRNPMYLGLSLLLAGLGLVFGSAWFLLATPVAMFAVTRLAIEREERYLTDKFGQPYSDYLGRVRRWI